MMERARVIVRKVALNNQYLVTFSTLSPQISEYLTRYSGVSNLKDFLSITVASIMLTTGLLISVTYINHSKPNEEGMLYDLNGRNVRNVSTFLRGGFYINKNKLFWRFDTSQFF